MRFFVFIYGEKRVRRYLLSKDENNICRILLPKDDFSLDKTTFLELENISEEWYIKETEDYKINKGQFFQMETWEMKERILYRLNTGRKYILTFKEQEIQIRFVIHNNNWSIYQKYKLKNCVVIEKGNNVILIGTAEEKFKGIEILYENDKWILKNNIRSKIYVNELLAEGHQELTYGDIIYIFELIFIFFGEFIAIEKTERYKDANYLEKVIINSQESDKNAEVLYYREAFHRAPRIMESLEKKVVRIEDPPILDNQETHSIFIDIGAIVNMMFPMLGMNLFLIYGMKAEENQVGLYIYSGLFMTLISMICSVSWIIISRQYEKKEKRKRCKKKKEAYRKYLNRKNMLIKEQYEKTYRVLQSRYLSVNAYGMDETFLFLYLWNRNPYHEDFLMYRVGIGNMRFPMTIELSEDQLNEDENSLRKEARRIKERYSILHQVPILLDIKKYNQIGITEGYEDAGMIIIRNIILQIALCNCYTEVKIACVYDKERVTQYGQWDFCRWLPHIWDINKKKRFIAQNQSEARELFYDLFQIFKEREVESALEHSEKVLPHYILFIAKEEYLAGEMFSKYIFDKKQNYGLTVIWIVSKRERLPNTCKLVLENSKDFAGCYEVARHSQKRKSIRFDCVEKDTADKLIRTISGTRVAEIEEKRGLPDEIDFLHMYEVDIIDDLDIENRWEKNRTYDSCRVLIGRKEGGEACYLDVHERYHGPHGLLAGTTGSGKSEVLQTFILSMAINFSPEAINFLLIDYKGEGMSGLFSELPHISGKISNLSEGQAHRAMISIKSENRRRQKLFKEYKVNNINDYTRLFVEGSVKESIPHLMIIIDEFAELKKAEPEFMQELISVAQVGRSLGIHLILATQKPGGIVDDKIWSNSRFRICLKVQEREDSIDMLHNTDACQIIQAGRAYLQVGNNEVYDLFQAGWSGAAYQEEHKKKAVQMVSINGQTFSAENINIHKKTDVKVVKRQTQLEAINKYIVTLAKEKGYKKGKLLWMNPLPRYLYLKNIIKENKNDFVQKEKIEQWDERWNVCVGIFDDPENQERPQFYLNLIESGHIAICGQSVSGKSTFLQTFIFSFLKNSLKKDVVLYLLDYNRGGIDIYDFMSQVQQVVKEDEVEKIDILLHNIEEELKRRKNKLSGGTFRQYRNKTDKEDLPLVLIILDGFTQFSEVTCQRYEDILYRILREGEKLGVLIMITIESFSSVHISMRLSELFKTRICFYMKDTYSYTEVFDVIQTPVLPHKGIAGRGIAYYQERILEFQIALAIEERNDYKRQEGIIQILNKYQKENGKI